MTNDFGKIIYRIALALIIILLVAALVVLCGGCAGTTKAVTASASGKNLDLSGFVTMGELETANPETATPQGRFAVGRLNYKSRRVGIPAYQKVPTTGNFRATKTKSLFGVEEVIIEYDWTAGSDDDAKKAEDAMKKLREAAEKEFEKKKTPPETQDSAEKNNHQPGENI